MARLQGTRARIGALLLKVKGEDVSGLLLGSLYIALLMLVNVM